MSELPRRGDVVRHKYQIERLIGQGGMAVVFSAVHLHMQQRVALKLLRPEAPRDPAIIERFVREARAAGRLQGPHAARVIDVDAHDDGTPFIVMEYLEGSDLLALLRQRTLGVAEAVGYVREACEAIGEAHALGIIHRDVKPANLFLSHTRVGPPIVKVLDFGISKVLEDTRITEEHVGMGSAEYMSPEQMRSAADVDARSDVWSLGVTLYELCTQQTPFHADGVGAVIAAVLTRDPAPPRQHRPDLPPGLDAVILRCLDRNPAHRFSSAAELSLALAPYGGPPAPAPAIAPAATPPGGARIPPLAFVAAAVGALIVLIIAFGLGSGKGGGAPAAKPKRERFQIDGDTVVDNETRLVWQRRPAPQAMDWSSARAHCARSGGYHLPEIEELRSLIAILNAVPPLDPENFTAEPIDVFWSASPAGPGAAMVVHFSKAHSASSVVSARNRVRCVR